MCEGKSFHIHVTVEHQHAAPDKSAQQPIPKDQSLCRDGMSAVRVNCRRYSGASACSAWWVHSDIEDGPFQILLLFTNSTLWHDHTKIFRQM